MAMTMLNQLNMIKTKFNMRITTMTMSSTIMIMLMPIMNEIGNQIPNPQLYLSYLPKHYLYITKI